jgi:hypothetical protein
MIKMKTRLAIVLAAITFVPTLRAQSFCSTEHRPDRVRVRLIGDCKATEESLQLRVGGDSSSVLVVPFQKNEGYWEGRGFTSMIQSVQLCSARCDFASSCISGKAVPDRDKDGTKICVADYEFHCDEEGWTLNVTSDPPVPLSYTRRRPDTQSVEQRGGFRLAPGRICGLASDEVVNLKPKVKTYTFRDIPVSRTRLEQEKSTWKLGPSKLLAYIDLPSGRRSHPEATDAEGFFVQQDLKELTLTIEKR